MSGRGLLGVRAGRDDGVAVVGGHGLAGFDELSYRVRARDTGNNVGLYSSVASATTQAASPPPSSTLVAAYAFDEGSGSSVADLSGNGNTGQVGSATWTSAGKFGKALTFNGSSAASPSRTRRRCASQER